jgi:cephalosporin-C deacetylase
MILGKRIKTGVNVQNLTKRIGGGVMMAVGLMDTICPPSTQFAAYNKIRSKKSLEIYPDFGHEGLPGQEDKTFQFMRTL